MALILIDTETSKVYKVGSVGVEMPNSFYISDSGRKVQSTKEDYDHHIRLQSLELLSPKFKRAMIEAFIEKHLLDPALLRYKKLKPIQTTRKLEI